jgi:nicotinate phosphoribosyltransferase
MPRRRKRLDAAAFALPVEQLRAGYFSDESYVRIRDVLSADGRSPKAVMQVTSKHAGYLGGIDEAIAILKLCADDWSQLAVQALAEGDEIAPWDTVMTIEGPYAFFAHLETAYLGTLSRRTRVCTNARAAVDAARPKQVIFLGARDDHFLAEPGDGFAAFAGGVTMVTTLAHAALAGLTPLPAVSHGLIAAYKGDTVRATKAFAETLGTETRILALADYDNDCVKTSLDVARALEERIWGVRLDTPETMVDKSIIPQMGTIRPTGVSPRLVWNVRDALDAEGFGDVQIVVSGGINAERIKDFEEAGAAVDAYGIGSGMLDGRWDFTADIVRIDGKPQGKAGRSERDNPKLLRVN